MYFIIKTHFTTMKITTKKIGLASVGFLAMLLLTLFLVPSLQSVKAVSFTPISGQMGIGSRGNDVTNLQTFLASNYYIYPEAKVTGYYGNLTANAVAQFQLNYGLPMVGRVGPLTIAKINSIIATGYGLDISAPIISGRSVQTTKTSAFVNWFTNETAKGKVYYSAAPWQLNETPYNFTEPIIIGGAPNAQSTTPAISQNIQISGLQPNTLYYYMIVSTDLSGNVSVTIPSTFTTNP